MIIPLFALLQGLRYACIYSLTHKHKHTHTHTHTHKQDDIFADQQVGPVFNDDGMFSCGADVLLVFC
jgi:hypothetical protein